MPRFVLLSLLGVASVAALHAQTGSVRIRVTDVNGRAISGATVSLYNNWNRRIGEFSTSPAGEFVLPRLSFGEWRFTVVASGFAPDAFAVNVCDKHEQLIRSKLAVAPPDTDLNTITVNAEAALLKLDPMPYCNVLALPQPAKRK